MQTLTDLIQVTQQHKGDWVSLAAESGVSYSWLTKFAQGHIPNPGLATLTKLTTAIQRRESRQAA